MSSWATVQKLCSHSHPWYGHQKLFFQLDKKIIVQQNPEGYIPSAWTNPFSVPIPPSISLEKSGLRVSLCIFDFCIPFLVPIYAAAEMHGIKSARDRGLWAEQQEKLNIIAQQITAVDKNYYVFRKNILT